MAKLAVSGLMPFRKGDDVPHAPSFAWQLIRGAAVSSPKVCSTPQRHLCCLCRSSHSSCLECEPVDPTHATLTTPGADSRPACDPEQYGCCHEVFTPHTCTEKRACAGLSGACPPLRGGHTGNPKGDAVRSAPPVPRGHGAPSGQPHRAGSAARAAPGQSAPQGPSGLLRLPHSRAVAWAQHCCSRCHLTSPACPCDALRMKALSSLCRQLLHILGVDRHVHHA